MKLFISLLIGLSLGVAGGLAFATWNQSDRLAAAESIAASLTAKNHEQQKSIDRANDISRKLLAEHDARQKAQSEAKSGADSKAPVFEFSTGVFVHDISEVYATAEQKDPINGVDHLELKSGVIVDFEGPPRRLRLIRIHYDNDIKDKALQVSEIVAGILFKQPESANGLIRSCVLFPFKWDSITAIGGDARIKIDTGNWAIEFTPG